MKPFDLEKALAGERVVTRSGLPVPEVKLFTTVPYHNPTLACVIQGNVVMLHRDGRFGRQSSSDHPWDLFMAPVTRFVNVYQLGNEKPHMGRKVYETREEAIAGSKATSYKCITTIEFEV